MLVAAFIEEVRAALRATFAEVDSWFEKGEELRAFRPSPGGWTIDQVLEHISLTNHYLLIIIDKTTEKARKRAETADLRAIALDYQPQRDRLSEVGIHRSFPWIRPEHMEPNGLRTSADVRNLLQDQLKRCFAHLENMPNGEGLLVRTTMTVNDLGKLDVYEYLYFLAQHARRHLEQMSRNESEYQSQLKNPEGQQSADG